jgi:hypothetical protein
MRFLKLPKNDLILFIFAVQQTFATQDSEDIVQLHTTVSLLCPVGQGFIEIPVRSKLCNHVQCFDLETYLVLNKNTNSWKCPICSCSATIDHLFVDDYMFSILREVGSDDNGESVKINKTGEWDIFEVDTGDHSESDDDTPVTPSTSVPILHPIASKIPSFVVPQNALPRATGIKRQANFATETPPQKRSTRNAIPYTGVIDLT